MQEIVDLVQKVAKLPATVLILGESGTGKELLARLIHRESGRRDAPFIAVNLAAIPRDLVESSLFGHERGAFTGAHTQQLGKFELASGGTLFLDEIADLRLEVQAKLLRAIQEGEIERVGGARVVKTDFHLVVATNIELAKAVKEGKFREDLYYRINVIPFRLPPLRERIEDLPDLVRFFLERYKARFRKPIQGISNSAVKILMDYRWPGNVRELENLVERLGGHQRQGLDHRGRPASRIPPRAARSQHRRWRRAPTDRLRHLRAQLHSAGARTGGLERVRHGPLSRHPSQHAEAQDGSVGHSRASQAPARRLIARGAQPMGTRLGGVSVTDSANFLAGVANELAGSWTAARPLVGSFYSV